MWSYNTNIDSEMNFFSSHEETVFAIMCVMRFKAVTNEVPDYYIYKDGKHVETLEGDYLYQLYIENGGKTLDDAEQDLQSKWNSDLKIKKEPRRKQIGGKCVLISRDNIIIENNISYKRLVLETMGKKGILLNEFVLEQDSKILQEVLSSLTERESDILKLLYGIYNLEEGGKSRTEVSQLYGISSERVKQIEAKTLRKLRHPSRNTILLGEKLTNNECEISIEHSNKFKHTLIEELEELIKMSDVEFIYLDKIMERYNIEIKNETKVNCDLIDMGLSVRAYNCLLHGGIKDLATLMSISDAELGKVRILDRKSYEEIKEVKRKRFELNKSEYIMVVLRFNGETVKYKCAGLEVKEIAKTILEDIETMVLNKKGLFETQLSSRLLEMLLIKGYLFLEDVLEDAILLIEQFENCELVDISTEIKELFNNEKKKNTPVYLYPAKSNTCKFIKNNNCTSSSDFIYKAREIEDEDIQNLVRELIDNEMV